jgi:hypothetical protein
MQSMPIITKSCSWRGVHDTTLYDKVCQWLATGWWFSPGPPVSSTNKTDRHDITEILLKCIKTYISCIIFTEQNLDTRIRNLLNVLQHRVKNEKVNYLFLSKYIICAFFRYLLVCTCKQCSHWIFHIYHELRWLNWIIGF